MSYDEHERREAYRQAIASTRLEGHEPTPEFLADRKAVIQGTMTPDQARSRSLARAIEHERRTADQETRNLAE